MAPDDSRTEVDGETIQMVAERLRAESLEPLTPEEGLSLYLQEKQSEYAETTINTHESRLRHFIDFCKKRDEEPEFTDGT